MSRYLYQISNRICRHKQTWDYRGCLTLQSAVDVALIEITLCAVLKKENSHPRNAADGTMGMTTSSNTIVNMVNNEFEAVAITPARSVRSRRWREQTDLLVKDGTPSPRGNVNSTGSMSTAACASHDMLALQASMPSGYDCLGSNPHRHAVEAVIRSPKHRPDRERETISHTNSVAISQWK